jgi:gamma-glutamylputrescine oxidase
LAKRFGDADAANVWRAASDACEHVRTTLQSERIECDYLPCDSVYAEIGGSDAQEEHAARRRIGLSSTWYGREDLGAILGDARYDGAMRYGGTFAVTPYRYAIGLRDRLREKDVRVYERSPVIAADAERVSTSTGSVRAAQIFFCADRDLADLGHARAAAYHAQTFLAATPPLPSGPLDELFPDGNLLVWDTDLVYHYFRRTADQRLLLGGGLLRKTYAPPADPAVILDDLRAYLRHRIPKMADLVFSNVWSGLIGVTKDFLPLAGRDVGRPSHFYAGCAAGIPWSVLAARCAVEAALDGGSAWQRFFDPHRRFTLDRLQPVLRKSATFALSHAMIKR